jgi:hypothetical protein
MVLIIGEMFFGDSHTTRPEEWLNKFSEYCKVFYSPLLIHAIGEQELGQNIADIARNDTRYFTMDSNCFVCSMSLTNTLRLEKFA